MKAWRQPSPYGELTVVVTDAGVQEISLPGDDQPDVDVTAADRAVARQLDDWFAGTATSSTSSSTSPRSTASGATVLETLVREVPWGEAVTYGELAALAGARARRAPSGSAMRNNPIPFVIPCHRVVAAGNKIGGYGGGRNAVALKRELLAREGVSTLR